MLTWRPRQPVSGVSNATAFTFSAGSHTERTVPSSFSTVSTLPPKLTVYITSGRSNSHGLPADSQSSGSSTCQPSLIACRKMPWS